MCFIGLRSRVSLSISALSGHRGRNAHAYGICASFHCISLKNIYEGGGRRYNAARSLISRDIAKLLAYYFSIVCNILFLGDKWDRWWLNWRLFFLVCAETFGMDNGAEWGVSHYLFKKR